MNQGWQLDQVYAKDDFLCGIGCRHQNKGNDATGLLVNAEDTDERGGCWSSNDEEGHKRKTLI